ncbi:MOSC domain-containing protein [Pseudoroseicyclus tamaricis]|uniref:MOSC domain-containing protein n=1 Tax=Pseudoroseicyclus tamaricis TaxID=2705421 RepID=A0A6B2JIV1_9RHOB|nr:MOSC N-terminal beta barrel domain-containing protein [Pseudoroseicyclus tamaricis]NDV01333.1 MOSC domain-containing protein [Pseudoroseicyclus tamaricis]
MLTITDLWIYPVKSLGGVHLQSAEATPEGSLRHDREWLVVDEAGAMLWQGDLPRMTLLRVGFAEGMLTISTPDGASVSVAAGHNGAPCTVTQYGNSFAAIDAGGEAAEFLSDWLGQPVRLVRIGDLAHRWPKVNPLHVLTHASIAALNERLAAGGTGPMPVQRFRPNVLLSGGSAFIEERLAEIAFDGAALVLREPSTRCELVNISLKDAAIEREPLRTIAGMSRERETARRGSFGVYSMIRGPSLNVGMTAD